MISKRAVLILGVTLVLVSILGVCASDNNQYNNDIQAILNDTNESELIGCCSVVLQLEGNDSILSFRRDANLTADIHIEEIDWHGIPAIRQYKVDGGYFCQVIVTHNGWIIGYGGIDDGDDNAKIENITSKMITDDNSIPDEGLAQIEEIKKPYKLGHVLIKAPNGNFGIATDKGHFTSHLEPGEYMSMPNRYKYSRTGNISLNTSDKITEMIELAASDVFGLTRRDITTYYYHQVNNSTFKGNITDIFLTNDDGSISGWQTRDLVDDVYFNNTKFEAEEIPLAPDYESIGSIEFKEQSTGVNTKNTMLILVVVAVIIAILFWVVYTIIRSLKNR